MYRLEYKHTDRYTWAIYIRSIRTTERFDGTINDVWEWLLYRGINLVASNEFAGNEANLPSVSDVLEEINRFFSNLFLNIEAHTEFKKM